MTGVGWLFSTTFGVLLILGIMALQRCAIVGSVSTSLDCSRPSGGGAEGSLRR